jgi:hypothetical protein
MSQTASALLVEDDYDTLNAVVAVLERLGLTVVHKPVDYDRLINTVLKLVEPARATLPERLLCSFNHARMLSS